MKCALDFETYYDDEYSLRKMSAQQYCRDPRFNAYCVSFAREDGVKYVGHPSGFDWNLLRGQEVWMHNAAFDSLVLKRLQRDGKAPADLDCTTDCTADLVAFHQSGRSLAAAAKNFLGQTLQKDTRDKMKGRVASTCDAALSSELTQYAQQDADTCLELAIKLSPQWPDIERKASRLTRKKGDQGVPLDMEYLGYCKRHMEALVHGYLNAIPWYPDAPPLSVPAMREHARKVGIPTFPASLSKQDAAAEAWFNQYGPAHPWIEAVRNFRRANTIYNRVLTLWNGQREGVFPFELLYFGAGTTGRWSGGGVVLRRRGYKGTEEKAGTFNLQNMPRDTMFGVNLRYCFKAPEGKAFYIVDYSQIECRILLWRAGDEAMLNLIRQGVHPYKAYAIQHLGAPADMAKSDPLYPVAKACVLGCGYQAGGKAFRRAAKALAGLDISEEKAKELVYQYRDSNPKIVQYWAMHQRFLEYSVNAGDPAHEIELASGRVLRYFNPKNAGLNEWGKPQIEVEYTQGIEPDHVYGGLLTENEIQATARDVLRDGWVTADEKGFDVPFTVHDEYVAIGPSRDNKKESEEFSREFVKTVTTASPWMEGCPLGVEVGVTEHYEK